MKNVRKDVQAKLLQGYFNYKKANPQQGGFSYHTKRADHYLSIVNNKYCFTSIYYDGTIAHTETAI